MIVVTANVDEFLKAPLRVVALTDNNAESLLRSASGGAFPVLARPILEDGGVIFGAEMLSGGKVRHVGITDVDELPRLQGSKYVQSDIAGTFGECADALLAGKSVLYSGTPCQIFALRSYLESHGLGDSPDGLYTTDLICHGVTSPALFRLYIEWLEKKVGALPGSLLYEFRSKRRGWGLYYYYYYYVSKRTGKEKSEFGLCDDDPYYAAFLSGKFYRSSCYSCRFACGRRVGDFTIGDYWGIEQAHPDFERKNGASVVLVNTPKGMEFFSKRCENACFLEESRLELARSENHNLNAPSVRSKEDVELAKRIEAAVRSGDANLVFDQILRVPLSAKRIMRGILPEWTISTIKKILHK